MKHVRRCSILLTKITTARNEAMLSYNKVCGQDFPAVIFAATTVVFFSCNVKIVNCQTKCTLKNKQHF